jgi:hypothetical protein
MGPRARTVAAGFALATSWTWCIGMFAPVLLARMFGWPGIVAFAVPNVLGCALFGYLRSRERSVLETRDHALAMAVFSAATVAYQVYFVGWIGGPMLAESMRSDLHGATALLAGGLFAAALALSFVPRRALWAIASLAFLTSLATFAFLPWGRMNALPASGEWSAAQLGFVLPTIVFGFALSPNLDLTFHRARQEAPEGARPHAFGVFGIAFASMLVLTTCYAMSPQGLMNPAVRAHILTQLVLTSALHLSELRAVGLAPSLRTALALGAGALGLGAALAAPSEATYMRFLGLYGLLFPAYAALALRTVGRPSLKALVALGLAMAAVVPVLDASFTDEPVWSAPVAVVLPLLAIVLFARRTPSASPR